MPTNVSKNKYKLVLTILCKFPPSTVPPVACAALALSLGIKGPNVKGSKGSIVSCSWGVWLLLRWLSRSKQAWSGSLGPSFHAVHDGREAKEWQSLSHPDPAPSGKSSAGREAGSLLQVTWERKTGNCTDSPPGPEFSPSFCIKMSIEKEKELRCPESWETLAYTWHTGVFSCQAAQSLQYLKRGTLMKYFSDFFWP